jgi:hypothetical protein
MTADIDFQDDQDDDPGEDAYSERHSEIDPSSELLICQDPDYGLASNAEGPVYEGPKDEPIWALFINDEDGDYFEEWSMLRLGTDLTYQGAIDPAETLGLYGRIIGFRGPDE